MSYSVAKGRYSDRGGVIVSHVPIHATAYTSSPLEAVAVVLLEERDNAESESYRKLASDGLSGGVICNLIQYSTDSLQSASV
jgi:hypothetical protein